MMKHDAVYQKSAKGLEAVATRTRDLSPKLRSVLILVDGKRSVDELTKLAAALGDAGELLAQLEAAGMIEAAAATAPALGTGSSAPAAADTGAAAAASTVPLKEAQRFAVRLLTDILGPNAEELCLRIEAARSANDFFAAVTRADGLLRQIRGAAVAASFMDKVNQHRPG